MDGEKVPRRLRRFYREKPEAQSNFEPSQFSKEEEFGKDYITPSGRTVLGKIPSMDYEDITAKKNIEEIQKLEKSNMEEKLALEAVEKFKREKKRMPTKEETDSIADNLYTQFKDVDTSNFYSTLTPAKSNNPIKDESSLRGRDRRDHRRGRSREVPKREERRMQGPPKTISNVAPVGNIKDLFGEEDIEKEVSVGDNDLEGLSEIGEDFDLNEDGETCPNCKAKTDKVFYCSKCGSAYCSKCGTKNGSKVCPKCGTKN